MHGKIFTLISYSHNKIFKGAFSTITSLFLLWFLILFLVTVVHGCGVAQTLPQKMVLKGKITVADSIDSSGDYSRIMLQVIKHSVERPLDTLFTTYTDIKGHFYGEINVPKSSYYTLDILRWNKKLYSVPIILAPKDTLEVIGVLPDIQNNIALNSREHKILSSLERLNIGYNKVLPFINTNKLSDDEIKQEWNKWAKLYWDMYQQYKGTVASGLAAKQALLFTLDKDTLQERYYTIAQEHYYPTIVALQAKDIVLPNKTLTELSAFLDSLKLHTPHREEKILIDIEHITILQANSDLGQAIERVNKFMEQYKDNSLLLQWAQRMMYDINHLSTGLNMPKITFELADSSNMVISNDSFLGKVSILEFTLITNPTYLEQYDRAYLIYNLFQNDDFKIYTLPFDENNSVIDAFIKNYTPFWGMAFLPSIKRQRNELVRRFNITEFPVRILIDRNGKIIKKISGKEFNDNQIIQYLQKELPRNE